jgi:aspartate kinase
LPGYLFMGKILEVINKYQINVISMTSSNVSISMMLTGSRDTLRIIERELHKYAEMVMDENMSVIHIIGSHYLCTAQIKTN